MSALALEIDQALQRLDAATAQRLERLVRDALDLVQMEAKDSGKDSSLRFPLVTEAQPITSEDVADLLDEA